MNLVRNIVQRLSSYKVNIWKNSLINYVLLGFLVRLFIASFTGWTDLYFFCRLSLLMLADPKSLIYQYLPPWYLTIFAFIKPLSLFHDPSDFAISIPELDKVWYSTGAYLDVVTSPTFNFVFKLPWILSDFATAMIIYAIVKNLRDEKLAKKAFILWFFNPLTILVSSVLGQSDSIITFLMLASLYLILQQKYFSAGVSLGLSIFYKTYNAYIMIFYFLAVIFWQKNIIDEKSLAKEKYVSRLNIVSSFKFLSGLVLPFVMLMPSLKYFGSTYFARVTFPLFGGFNIFFINLAPIARNVMHWVYSNSQLIITSLFLIGILSVLIVCGLVIFRMRKTLDEKMVCGSIYVLVITYLTMPLASPHHYISVFPFLILAITLYNRCFWRYTILWFSGFVFILSIYGVAFLFYPLAAFTSVVSIEAISQNTLAYWNAHGLICDLISHDLMLLFSALGFVTLLSLICPYKKLKEVGIRRENA